MAGTTQWQDLFVVYDDGNVGVGEYQRLEPLLVAQAAQHAKGLCCLVVIPDHAVMPPAAVRAHLQAMLARLPMRALAYVVEGQGFKAAAVRGVLLGLGVFAKQACATRVFTELQPALQWLFDGGGRDIGAALQAVNAARPR